MTTTLNRMLRDRGLVPCRRATAWLGRRRNAQKAWDALKDGTWMFWILRRAKKSSKFKRQVARMLKDLRTLSNVSAVDRKFMESYYRRHHLNLCDRYLGWMHAEPVVDYVRRFFPNPPDLKCGR